MRPARVRVALALTLAAMAMPIAASDLTGAEKKEGLAQLERTQAALVKATQGLSEEQWKFKPAPDQWSAAEVVEHIVLAEEMMLDHIAKNVMPAPAGAPDRDIAETDKLVTSAIADRSTKVQAPEMLAPTGRWTPRESLDRFREVRARSVDLLQSTPGLRDHVTDSPLRRPLDGYQWLLYIAAHSDRHTQQILEVKADPGFPK